MPNNEFGDFQTPIELARALVNTLPRRKWTRVLEPTCGVGNFLSVMARSHPEAERVGIEVQPEYASSASQFGRIITASIFDFDLARDVDWTSEPGPTLVIGNPPWVTNSQLSVLDSANRPTRANTKNARGIDAITGSSNFDIAEYIWIKLLTEFSDRPVTIAMICKTQVARNVLLHCAQQQLPVTGSSLRIIDAKKWFDAGVDACWFTVELGPGEADYTAQTYPSIDVSQPDYRLGVVDGQLVANVDAYQRSKQFDGASPLTWRQGIKHDAAGVMELIENNGPRNKLGIGVDIEPDYLFPLFKCTDVYRDKLDSASRWMIVPQSHTGDDTELLAPTAPKLWKYLTDNAAALDGRKSSIYRNRARFCIFGVGPYTFAPYKIAISGFHKIPQFRMVGPYDGKPAVFDDATYLLPFEDPASCAVAHALLTGPEATDLIAALAFWDSKRPVTKKLLQRIDLSAIARATDPEALRERSAATAAAHGLLFETASLTRAVDHARGRTL
ncbi:SAM-dependent methyltransferase [Rhodococcus sp. 06-412-2C]|uniref:SAM-dependent methyltransferase n=1 Tax=unclassified Rhodococcus (in: high G+C Gram-positive bacteria) TaxID=192944 RepID=UPI000B9A8B48|nr:MULTISPECIES: SAM-dependent methyltransferase [unclassified Rhodococcus (in: high G+C Gram-positive bacteria)]OZC89893.1 SAM-dependent methyltransferase [Rhodococcus sp. 06-412-2C]OZC93356.1 SAM-dependent methyltransferase [Rhodococcus sp. 06-412-2B]